LRLQIQTRFVSLALSYMSSFQQTVILFPITVRPPAIIGDWEFDSAPA
jgi:hypothetical protein